MNNLTLYYKPVLITSREHTYILGLSRESVFSHPDAAPAAVLEVVSVVLEEVGEDEVEVVSFVHGSSDSWNDGVFRKDDVDIDNLWMECPSRGGVIFTFTVFGIFRIWRWWLMAGRGREVWHLRHGVREVRFESLSNNLNE